MSQLLRGPWQGRKGSMRRSSPTEILLFALTVAMCSLVLSREGFAEGSADALVPTRAKLDALQTCLGPSDALSTLRKGLLWGWPKPGRVAAPSLKDPVPAPPPPSEYLQTLDRDLQACDLASRIQDADQRRLVLAAVQKDIEIKAEDCHKFGMGRRVPVSIRTLRGTTAENGWQVFYKWSCASLLQPEEVRVPNLTSPANVDLPPGVYSVRAEKRTSAVQVQTIAPVTVVVGSVASVPLELAVQ
jgi:hypothetical protein